MPSSDPRDTLRLLAVVIVWAGVFQVLSVYGFDILPRALLGELTLEAYLSLIQLVTLGAGLGAAFALLFRPEESLPLRGAKSRGLAVVALVSPIVFSASTTVAFLVARPTLIAEILAGGQEAAQENTGRFGRELVQSPALLAFVWGAVISPVGEELFFRGALWSLVEGASSRVLRVRWLRESLTTVLIGIGFGLLHRDMPGGLGIVRFVSALGLGLACGFARQATGTVAAPMALHAAYNALSLAAVRRWVVTETFPMKYGAPTLVTAAGAIAAVAAVIVARARGGPSSRAAE